MDFQTSLNRIEELFRIMYLGLWVLWAETRWIAGPDIGYQRRLTLMRRRQGAIQDELSRMATLADPRREQLAVVTLTCGSGCNTCFCHWVGGGPTSPEGSDVLMTEIEGGYVLQAITPKGEELLAASSLAEGAEQFPKAEAARKRDSSFTEGLRE